MLTITHKQFKDLTVRSGPHYRSKYQDRVLEALEAYEDRPTNVALIALRGALREWKSNKATEFANRDQLSLTRLQQTVPDTAEGICTRLMLEVGLTPTYINKPESDLYAHEITLPQLRRAAYKLRRPADTGTAVGVVYTNLNKGVAAALDDNHAEAAVVLIDIEGPNGQIRPDRAANHGFHARFDELSVLEHQVDVLKAAAIRGVPVFDVTTTAPQAQTVQELSGLFEHLDVLSYKKRANNPFNGRGALRGDRNLQEDLEDSGRTVVIVMGYHANQCVNSTIFGNAAPSASAAALWTPGLLELGYTVVTARNVVASDNNAPLQAEYGPMV